MPQKNAGDAAPAIGFSGKERQFRAFRPIAGLDRVAAASHHRFRAMVLRGSDQSTTRLKSTWVSCLRSASDSSFLGLKKRR